jgi:hypothetical protein
MKTVELGSLPPGTQVRGILYDDPAHVYGLGDVLEVDLPTGLTIDVGWDEESTEGRFRIVVYREYFGDRFVDFHVRDVDDVVTEVQRLAAEWSRPCVATSSAETEAAVTLPKGAESGT